MSFGITTATKKIRDMTRRIRAVPGGTSASKTVSIIIYLISKAQADKTPTLTSIVSESFPHLRRGSLRDFENIMKEHGYWSDKCFSKTDWTYTFDSGSKIEFFSVDQPDKLRGARRDRLFLNEANNVPFDAFEQLEVRTKDFVFLDWNPTSEFWYYTDVKTKRNDVEELVLTYKDNEGLDKRIIESIEARKNRKGWWQVYGLGLLGEVEGRIYKDWIIIDEIPKEAKLIRRGLDFGYSVDPTAIVDVYKFNGAYIFDEICYTKGLSNRQIADLLIDDTQTLVVADSAEPKSIDEIRSYGVIIRPAVKGPGSVSQGIQFIQDQRVSVTKRSANMIKEYRNYLWDSDRNGKILQVPVPGNDHCMDALRYALSGFSETAVDDVSQRKAVEAYINSDSGYVPGLGYRQADIGGDGGGY